MIDLKSLDMAGLESFVASLGWEKYRARQLFAWVWQKGVSDFELMTNLAKPRREELKTKAVVRSLKLERKLATPDGTTKYHFGLDDGLSIESVFIPDPPRRTVCVSSQVGCALGCDICFTGKIGFKRNLRFHEIADQVLQIDLLAHVTTTNVVMMGMGEPMLNLDEVIKASDLLNSDLAFRIGARHITISTAGIPEGIRRLADYPKQFKLAVSLNATEDDTRSRLMPINRKYPLETLFQAIEYYTGKTRKRVTFEYVLIHGVNDFGADAQRLVKLLKYVPCKINLIPLNDCPDPDLRSPTESQVQAFADLLYPQLPAVTIRKSRGGQIHAACGQLAANKAGPQDVVGV